MFRRASNMRFQEGEPVLAGKEERQLTVKRYSAIRQLLGRPYVLCGAAGDDKEHQAWFRERDLAPLDVQAYFAPWVALH
jgi:hypothetical protein